MRDLLEPAYLLLKRLAGRQPDSRRGRRRYDLDFLPIARNDISVALLRVRRFHAKNMGAYVWVM